MHNIGKTTTHKLKLIDRFRFMATSLSNLVDNLSEINKKECKACMERKNIKSECDFIELENNKLLYKCKTFEKIWLKPVNGLIKKLCVNESAYQFCNGDLNKFVLLLGKGVYPYEYMDSWEIFNETSLPDKEAFYSNPNLKDISDKNYTHGQKVWKVFEIKNFVSIMTFMFKVILYCLLMCLRTLETNVLKFMNLIPLILCLHGKLA